MGQLVELGAVIKNPELGRTKEDQITVADLTGVAVQDIQIAKLTYEYLTHYKSPIYRDRNRA